MVPDRLDLRPHEKCKTARELGWVFVMERIFGETVFRDRFEEAMGKGGAAPLPASPESWEEILGALEEAHRSRMADGKVPSIYGPTADEPWT